MKKFFTAIASLSLAALMLFSGCSLRGSDGRDGRDGKDGQDVTIESVYNKYVEENGEISFSDFLREYLNYTDAQLEQALSYRTAVNHSLMAGVSILTQFSYTEKYHSGFGGITSSRTTNKVYSGSGAILWLDKAKGDAYVVTNCHVVYDDSSDSIFSNKICLYLYGQDSSDHNYTLSATNEITGDENYRIPATVIGASVTYDIALLKVTGSEVLKRSNAEVATFSEDSQVYLGETVYAVGNASGEGMSATNGVISMDSEYIEVSLSDLNTNKYNDYRVLRTTAAINHGNSGGALYNAQGKIVGIVNAKDDDEKIDNKGYALPANMVRRILQLMYDNYIENGSKMVTNNGKSGGINKAFLNISTSISDSYSVFNSDLGVAEIKETVVVNKVEGLPAKGNLQAGDILKFIKVISSDGTEKEFYAITRSFIVPDTMFSVRKGDSVVFTVERSGNVIDVPITFSSSSYFKYFE